MDKKRNEIYKVLATRLDSYECSYKWIIKNFVFWANQELTSPSFGINDLRLTFHIKFCYTENTLTLKLCRETELLAKLEDKSINIHFSLLNESSIIFTESLKSFLRKNYHSYDIPIANDEQLIKAKPILFADKMMRILCKISIHPGTMKSVDCCDENVMSESFFALQLSDGIKSFAQSETFSDVLLISNGKQFPAHKIVLSAQSPVFSAMFQSSMVETKKNEVIINDIKPKVLQEMLRYMYTGKVEHMSNIENDLLYAADKYNIVGLKLMCSKALSESMTTKNVIDILILADKYDATLLKAHALTFIAQNAKKLIEMGHFNEVIASNPDLRKDILRAMC